MTILPAGAPPMVTSKKTRGLDMMMDVRLCVREVCWWSVVDEKDDGGARLKRSLGRGVDGGVAANALCSFYSPSRSADDSCAKQQ